ncbi:MAG: glycerol-3-phosphate 1-O-acyltransferase PlsY [Rhodospirillales bacterium]|nr:glycerol-3-phosphate 1-O-acyltransferase PlsY [Rhodospirillales bacterium]
MLYLVAAVAGYLLGSVPFGLVLSRLFGAGDIRKIGSGNIGATNVLRTGKKGLAAATLLLDGGKGAVAVLVFATMGDNLGLLAGFTAVLGHNFPVWLRFKGGKGVATTLGVLLAASWPVGILACLTWLVIAVIFRYSSLSALVALAAAPVYAYVLDGPNQAALAAALGILSFIRHHENIRRLIRGEETKIGDKKS